MSHILWKPAVTYRRGNSWFIIRDTKGCFLWNNYWIISFSKTNSGQDSRTGSMMTKYIFLIISCASPGIRIIKNKFTAKLLECFDWFSCHCYAVARAFLSKLLVKSKERTFNVPKMLAYNSSSNASALANTTNTNILCPGRSRNQ